MSTFVRRDARGAPALDARRLRSTAELMLHELELGTSELSILLTNDAGIQELNRTHRGKDKPTDVLAFPLDEDGESAVSSEDTTPRLLGDVVISLDTALRQAQSRKRELFAEVRFLLAHGVLHLIGYDHATPAEKRVMSRLTRRLVRVVERQEAEPPRGRAGADKAIAPSASSARRRREKARRSAKSV